nr:synaptotagmin-like protein 2 [Nerophis lumbriciformis]
MYFPVSSFSPSISSIKQHQIRSTWVQTSLSLPVLQQNEADSDSLLETSFDSRRNTGSSASNISFSSGMDSMPNVSDSSRSICTVDFSGVEVQGRIHYAVNYIQRLQEFHIFVVLCKDLAAADTKRHSADAYVKCYLLPDKIKLGKRKTKVKKHTLNPTFNEILKFKTKLELLKTQSLYISVWHNNTFGRNTFLGEVDQDMSGWDLSNTQIHEYTLKPRVSGQTSIPSFLSLPDSRGLMRVSLRFLLQTSHRKKTSTIETGEVQIWVKDCKNLTSKRGPTMDPFVKCTVLPDVSGKSQQKSRVVKRTANPMFNHNMTYDGLRPDDLREACVEITVWNHDRRNPHYIGGIRLGLGTGKSYGIDVVWMDSTMGEANLWKKMLESGGQWVEDILPLRMLVTTK